MYSIYRYRDGKKIPHKSFRLLTRSWKVVLRSSFHILSLTVIENTLDKNIIIFSRHSPEYEQFPVPGTLMNNKEINHSAFFMLYMYMYIYTGIYMYI